MKRSFQELQTAIREMCFHPNITRARIVQLPSDLGDHHVASFLTVDSCVNSQVKAVSASSIDSQYKLTGCLVDDTDSWWLSAGGSMPGGRGEEYVEFLLSDKEALRRLQAVSMAIPPVPAGPLSVREFRVDVKDEKGVWTTLPHICTVENIDGMQRFPIGDVDATSIRVFCLSNQISAYLDAIYPSEMERVGYYAAKFE